MFLASCSYMLRPLIAGAAEERHPVPQSVPQEQRLLESDPAFGQRGSTASRILSLLVAHPAFGSEHHPWTHGDLAQWAEVPAGQGRPAPRRKEEARRLRPASKPATMERLDEIFEPAAFDSLMAAWEGDYRGLLDWWRARVTADLAARVAVSRRYRRQAGAARACWRRPRWSSARSTPSRAARPTWCISFRISRRLADAQYGRGGAARDSVIRLFYVGVTRTRETLYLCQRETGMAVTI